MSYELPPTSPIFHEIDNLKLMDMNVGKDDQTVDFDAKHICKRTRNCTISPNFQNGNIRITKDDLTEILSHSSSFHHSINQLVNPMDKQNVKLATDFLVTFCSAVKSPKLKAVSF